MRTRNVIAAGLSVALLGLGALATAGSANAAACLKHDQTNYSLGVDQTDDRNDDIFAANKSGYRCDSGSNVSYYQMQHENAAAAAAKAQVKQN